ncbi:MULTISPECIES: alcohol dehydrogenase catalytic domain-containing protein [unclassified Mucilaginibacter]|uniref:alcohol dehydrogenase catalytic domain-containing protein n=1 Tax=unclassified Mucilaginibacter TaxID=2617802 RepID=UPI002AC9A446|nr:MULTISPECIES: alcohol dehydrogenase catalytic domain-containing protein [unclassified Mucilaginibacter]MEB0249341.1 alcohol dehydrogenase catalytic domain-containing protein [Mucilaginibacter sp. 5B2]MEB0262482.1 alcohol dehydrogenase catalytic domain-containing protein [Mucilaginibacter sp. 10I4]MEB0279922.1 alcohol dehydrogenase catalytic domain-containing protein [Mucilaginibacter sp. 10B2]MEB0300068.1 alcohol dehydrogenase catalytic domain-containing protein [Mucilaginibacter sp. 5C4]WP
MKAAVFHKPGDIRYDTVEDRRIEDPRDVILKVTSIAICGSDLYILSGGVPQKEPMVMGHEFMCIVAEVGSAITNLKKKRPCGCAVFDIMRTLFLLSA